MAQFLSNLPINSLIKFGHHSVGSEEKQHIIWRVADKNHNGYPSNSVTLIADKSIDIRVYDRGEGSENLKNCNYGLSNIDQWLNSSGSADNWYTPSHSADAEPSYSSRPGFLYNFTENERLALLPTTIPIQMAANVSSKVAKVFLPTAWEILGSFNYADGTSRLACFASTDVTTYLSAQAFANTTSSYAPSSADILYNYATRSTIVSTGSNSYYVIFISAKGAAAWSDPRSDVGIRPCVNLSANTKVSDSVDEDGCYEVLFNAAPVISESNTDLGVKKAGFSQTYTITDADENESVTVTEYLDNVKMRSYVAKLGESNSFDITGETWLKLANGVHTLKITATDGFDEPARVFTFTKEVAKLVVQRSTPIPADSMPTRLIVTVVKNIPAGATFKVEACNNAYDGEYVVWDDITDAVLHGQRAYFSNVTDEEKTAINPSGKWGVNIRVTVERNGAEGACYITEIGGNFD